MYYWKLPIHLFGESSALIAVYYLIRVFHYPRFSNKAWRGNRRYRNYSLICIRKYRKQAAKFTESVFLRTVNQRSKNQNGSLSLVVTTIASPFSNYMTNDIKNLKYLRGLRLAHAITNDSTFAISLLICTDYYWYLVFVEDNVIRGIGPTAVKPKLGYLLSGPVVNLTRPNRPNNVGMFNILTAHKPEEFDLERFWKLIS